MKFIKTPVKGMVDMLPQDMRLRRHVLDIIRGSYSQYGFMEIETPVMEHIENLTSKQGGDNEKLIFKVLKRGADLQRAIDAGKGEYADNGLRYDLTLPLARYYANNREKLPAPFKALQMIGSSQYSMIDVRDYLDFLCAHEELYETILSLGTYYKVSDVNRAFEDALAGKNVIRFALLCSKVDQRKLRRRFLQIFKTAEIVFISELACSHSCSSRF